MILQLGRESYSSVAVVQRSEKQSSPVSQWENLLDYPTCDHSWPKTNLEHASEWDRGWGFNSNKLVRGKLLTTTMVADVLDCLPLHLRRTHLALRPTAEKSELPFGGAR